MTDQKIRRPILRYHGGKFRLAPWIISHFPPHVTYVEPYGGAASVLLRKPPSEAQVYGEKDWGISEYVKFVKFHGEALAREIEAKPYLPETYAEAYCYNPVSLFPSPIQLAVRSYMGHGSDSIHRKNGFRRHPIAEAAWKTLPDAIRSACKRLQGVITEQCDAWYTIRKYDHLTTLFYIDPPYIRSTRSGRQAYGHEMTDADHVALADLLHNVKGKVIISGYRCDLYDRLYAGWRREDRETFADGARKRVESLWLNF